MLPEGTLVSSKWLTTHRVYEFLPLFDSEFALRHPGIHQQFCSERMTPLSFEMPRLFSLYVNLAPDQNLSLIYMY